MILEAVKQNPKLKLTNIDLSGNSFGPTGISNLFKAFQLMQSLVSLTLSGVVQKSDAAAMKLLLAGAKQCSTLRTLDISANQGANDAIPELISLLTSLVHHLRFLNISKLGLQPKNIDKVEQALISEFGKDFNLNCTLRVLKWEDNMS